MFRRACNAEALYCTLGHIRGMLKDYGFPVAPECWDPTYKPWGDMYYNWDGAMVPLLIERLAGVRYSIPEKSFTVSDHLPDAWRYVETYTPVVLNGKTIWTRAKIERAVRDGRVEKKILVEDCPLQTLLWKTGNSSPAIRRPAARRRRVMPPFGSPARATGRSESSWASENGRSTPSPISRRTAATSRIRSRSRFAAC